MSLRFARASSQYLYSPIALSARQPLTISLWFRRASTAYWCSLASVGDSGEATDYQSIQTADDRTRAIAWDNGSAPDSTYMGAPGTSVYHHALITFDSGNFTFYYDGVAQTAGTWSATAITIDQIRIGMNVSTTNTDYADDYIEHFAVWDAVLTSGEIAELYATTTSPLDIQPSYLKTYTPLIDSMVDSSGELTWTAVNLSSPSYESSGITYPDVSTTYTLTYNGNGAESGTVPVDGSSPYASGATVTVLGNTGSLGYTNFTFDGWNTSSDGSGTHYDADDTFTISSNTTLYAVWVAQYQYRTINHLNFDPASYSNAEVAAAALKKVYFEHASTGMDIIGDSDTDSSTGNNYDSSGDCGLALLYDDNNRYLMDRDHHDSGNDYTWFSSNTGLQDNNRGNPTPATKVSGFVGMSANMRGAVDIAMWKYCWIDVWPATSGYISDGAAAAASDISDIEAFETANPDITVVWWTMPLQSNESYQAREDYNDAIRTYCLENGKWLIDIADIECHNDADEKQTDGNGREIAVSSYMRVDGGHLADTGRLKMAKAFWSAITAIASDVAPAVYQLSDVTYDKNGDVLGSCRVSVFKHAGSGVYSYVGTAVSDASTGAFTVETDDGDSAYMIVAHKDGSPNVFDVTDNTLTPELST